VIDFFLELFQKILACRTGELDGHRADAGNVMSGKCGGKAAENHGDMKLE